VLPEVLCNLLVPHAIRPRQDRRARRHAPLALLEEAARVGLPFRACAFSDRPAIDVVLDPPDRAGPTAFQLRSVQRTHTTAPFSRRPCGCRTGRGSFEWPWIVEGRDTRTSCRLVFVGPKLHTRTMPRDALPGQDVFPSGPPDIDEAIELLLVEEQLAQFRAAGEGHGDAFEHRLGLVIADRP